ncbi:hypothetical protein GA0115255_108501, partial [Streptomyces sp. Ncost-T6T-2b]
MFWTVSFPRYVVDPEDLVGREDVVHELVELLRAGQVVTERLLDDGTPPGALFWSAR